MRRLEPTGRRGAIDGEEALILERTLPADEDACWRAIATSAGTEPWIGRIDGDRASGVRFAMTAEAEDAEAQPVEVRACEPPHRLGVTLAGPEGSAGWMLDLALARLGERSTALRFTHRIGTGPRDGLDWIAIGWEYYLDRLETALAGGDVGEVSWERGGYLELRRGYADGFGLRADSDAAETIDRAAAGEAAPDRETPRAGGDGTADRLSDDPGLRDDPGLPDDPEGCADY